MARIRRILAERNNPHYKGISVLVGPTEREPSLWQRILQLFS
jgi:hypothetical protein